MFCMGVVDTFSRALTLCCISIKQFWPRGISINIRERYKLEKFVVCHSYVQSELRQENVGRCFYLRFRWAICVSFMRMHEQLLLGGCVSMIFEKLETIHQEYLFLLLIVVEVTQNLAGCPSLYDSQSSLVGYAHYAVFFTSGVRKSNVGSKRTGCGF